MNNKKDPEAKDIRRYVQFFVPLMGVLKDHQGAVKLAALPALMVEKLHMDPKEQKEKMPDGSLKILNRIAWVKKILEIAGLLGTAEGNIIQLTEKGKKTKLGEDQDVYDVLSLAADKLDKKKNDKRAQGIKAFLSYLAKYGFEE